MNIATRSRPCESHRPWLVLLHGLQSSREMFDPIFDSPALAGRSLLAFDFFGFGESSKPDGFSYDLIDQTQVLYQALRSAGIKQAVLVGHSLDFRNSALFKWDWPDLLTRSVCPLIDDSV